VVAFTDDDEGLATSPTWDTRRVTLPYRRELEALPLTYVDTLTADIEGLRNALHEIGGGPALFVGAGGSMALAHLAARLHERVCRQPARACTPLEALDSPQLARRGAVLFSSSAKHPDSQQVLQDFQRCRFSPTVLVTHRCAEDLQEAAGHDCRIVSLPRPAQRDGFLATASILQIATLLLRAYNKKVELPDELEYFEEGDVLRDEVVVLTPPSLISVATDIEVRMAESGLASVQVVDYRNFAHGRHTGFARRSAKTTVIALTDGESRALAEASVATLPSVTDIRRWDGGEIWAPAVIRLLTRSMRLAGQVGDAVDLDIARPHVPEFGRRLYRLPLCRRLPARLTGGIERKLLAAGTGDHEEVWSLYSEAALPWTEEMRRKRFGGLVLDYDGTACWTRRRWDLPDAGLREALGKLLDQGAVIGFASGRGRSLQTDLRQWVNPNRWSQIALGLYNGAVLLTLDDNLPDLREPTRWSRDVISALEIVPGFDRLTLEERGAQVSVMPSQGVTHLDQLQATITNELARCGVLAAVASSGHAVDIVQPPTTKVSVTELVEKISGRPVLAVGDQGQLGGNDHALLAHDCASLSVDRCSADPASCWFIGTGELVGPALLHQYLRCLGKRRGGFALMQLGVV